jgi:hypothetical protein
MGEKVFIICVDLQTTADKEKLESGLKGSQYSNFQVLMERVYAVKAPQYVDSVMVRDFIRGKLDFKSPVFVMKTSLDAAWNIMSSSDAWLRNNV